MFKQWFLLWTTVSVFYLGLLLFLSGFFAIKRSVDGSATYDDVISLLYPIKSHKLNHPAQLASPKYQPVFKKSVIILIDALREDFIPIIHHENPESISMPFLEGLIKNGHAVGYKSRVYSPTVTLPRIKTVLSGTVPGFIDLILNLDAKELSVDNIVHQAFHSGKKKIVFYGDDIWLKILPNKFLRSEGTTSFFVSDYTEVDNNVTRNLAFELKVLDWDMLILHYLGLDHIGHSLGANSPMIGKKLIEMDGVIKQIYNSLKESTQESVVVVFGDHGMAVSGGHGGVSEKEMMTPLVFIPLGLKHTLSHQIKTTRTVLQVDIASTLSVLLGLPIPKSNYGTIIMDLLPAFGLEDQHCLFLLHYNFQQVL